MTPPTFVDILPTTANLGWRFDEVISEEAETSIETYVGDYDYRLEMFSPPRTVSLPGFSIASEPILWTELVENTDDVEDAQSLAEVCVEINSQLMLRGLRLPTEDEFEAAVGGSLFAWGDVIPNGIPCDGWTQFTAHKEPNAFGIRFNADTYATELTEGYLKFGDGGVSVCGGAPWPLAWMCFSPAFRLHADFYVDCLAEHLEVMLIHPVRIA